MSSVFAVMLTNVAVLAVNIATGMISARFLGPSGRGEFAAITMWPQLLAFVLSGGLPSALLYNLRKHADISRQLFAAALTIGLCISLFDMMVGFFVIPRWMVRYDAATIRFAQFCLLMTPVVLFGILGTVTLQARNLFLPYNIYQFLPPALWLISFFGLILAGAVTVHNVILALFFTNLPIFGVLLVKVWTMERPVWRDQWRATKYLVSYAVRSYGIDLLGTLSDQIGQIVIVGLLKPAALGIFAVAVSISKLLKILEAAIGVVFLPKMISEGKDAVIHAAGRVARINLAGTILASICMIIVLPWLIRLFYGAAFLDVMQIVPILLLEVAVSGTSSILAQVFMIVNRPGMVTLSQAIGLGITYPLLFLLTPLYGLPGVCYAILISSSIRLVFILASFPLLLNVKRPLLLLNWQDIRFVLQKLIAELFHGNKEKDEAA